MEDIRERIVEVMATQRKLRLAHSVSQLENPLKLRANRKIVARLKTELKKRQLAEKAAK